MPRIAEYGQQTSAASEIGGRRASADDVFALGPELGRSVGQVADVMQDAADRQEVSDVQAKLAKARADWTVAMHERAQTSSPGDPTFAPKFNEDFSKYLGEIEGKLQTKNGQMAFRKGAGELAAHFVEKAGVYQAQAMGAKAVQDYKVALNARQTELLSDFTQFQPLLNAALADINDPAGPYANMPAAKREELIIQTKMDLSKSAVQGMIQSGAPELAKKQLADGKWDAYLDADTKKALIDNAQVGINAKDSAAERQRMLEERERRDRQDVTMSKMLARVIDPKNNGGGLSDREILADPELTAAQKQHMIDYKFRRARELQSASSERANPGKVRELLLQVHAAVDDPRKTFNTDNIMEAYRKGEVTTPEMTFLRREVEQMRDGNSSPFQRQVQAARNAVYTSITRSTLGAVQPELAADAAYRFNADLEQQIAAKRAKNEDPRSLLDPTSKDYALKPERIQSFLTPARDAVAGEAARIKAGEATAVTGRLPTYRDFATLKSGAQFTDPQGNIRVKP